MSVASESPTQVIAPRRGWELPDLREVWRYRDLLYLLARRDLAVRYRQTAIGIAWAIVPPVAFALVLSLFLGFVLDAPSAGVPRPVFVLSGLTIWLLFSQLVGRASTSTLGGAALIEKVYFPRLVIPLSAVAAPVVDFLIALVVLVGAMLAFGVVPGPRIVLAPVAAVLAVALGLGLGLWLSALIVRFRDVNLAIAPALQLGLFATPVIYPATVIPEAYRELYALNPMVGVMELFRWAALPSAELPDLALVVTLVTAPVLLVTGFLVFARAQRGFADVI